MTATLTETAPLFERNPALYKRLFEITLTPGYSQGFKALASEAAHMGRNISPANLSTEAIRAALLESVSAERDARREREQAGDWDGSWPSIFDAFIDTQANGCRFETWCRGDCAASLAGDRGHWSVTHSITELSYGDTLGVDIFQIENPDGSVDPAQIILSYESADDVLEPVDIHLNPAEARKVGEVIRTAVEAKRRPDESMKTIFDLTFESGDRLMFTSVPRRDYRRGGLTDMRCFEFTLQARGSDTYARFADSNSGPRFLARYLAFMADDAEGIVQPMTQGARDAIESVIA